jgi:hypothetical protein
LSEGHHKRPPFPSLRRLTFKKIPTSLFPHLYFLRSSTSAPLTLYENSHFPKSFISASVIGIFYSRDSRIPRTIISFSFTRRFLMFYPKRRNKMNSPSTMSADIEHIGALVLNSGSWANEHYVLHPVCFPSSFYWDFFLSFLCCLRPVL